MYEKPTFFIPIRHRASYFRIIQKSGMNYYYLKRQVNIIIKISKNIVYLIFYWIIIKLLMMWRQY